MKSGCFHPMALPPTVLASGRFLIWGRRQPTPYPTPHLSLTQAGALSAPQSLGSHPSSVMSLLRWTCFHSILGEDAPWNALGKRTKINNFFCEVVCLSTGAGLCVVCYSYWCERLKQPVCPCFHLPAVFGFSLDTPETFTSVSIIPVITHGPY